MGASPYFAQYSEMGRRPHFPPLMQMGPRRKAREYALQMLFQWDITHDAIDQIATNFFQNHPDEPPAVERFARELVTGAIENIEDIDRMIQRHAEHWRLDRMA